jgi:hypothetical protein
MKNMRDTKRKFVTVILLSAVIISLAGCSNADKKLVTQLQAQISQLEKEKEALLIKNNEIISFFTISKLKNHIYDCANTFGGIQHVKFLSNSIVYVTGLDEYGAVMYNNYYIYSMKDQYTLTLVGDLDMPDSVEFFSYTNLLKITELLKTIAFSQDFETITITPINQYDICKLRK